MGYVEYLGIGSIVNAGVLEAAQVLSLLCVAALVLGDEDGVCLELDFSLHTLALHRLGGAARLHHLSAWLRRHEQLQIQNKQ